MQVKIQNLLRWYGRNKRDLPWRRLPRDPYKIWISEMMLQQTQVETVIPYYQRFLEVFPALNILAKAPLEEVLKLWSGLGYYSRARNLRKTARRVLDHFNGIFPKTKEELLKLPGIGPYSAGAVASIAFGQKVPVVDGNVIRVLTRLFALKGDPKGKPLKQKLWKLAENLVPLKRPGDFNQALMELGALVCLPKDPQCLRCPLRKSCKAYSMNKVNEYPTPREKLPTQKVYLAAALIEKNGSYLLARRGKQKHLQSMWEFPQVDLGTQNLSGKDLIRFLERHLGMGIELKGQLPTVRHAIMNRRISLTPFLCRYLKGKPKIRPGHVAYKWIEPAALENFPTSSINHKVVRHLNRKGQDLFLPF